MQVGAHEAQQDSRTVKATDMKREALIGRAVASEAIALVRAGVSIG